MIDSSQKPNKAAWMSTFEGDSIRRRWGATEYPQLLENWNKNFFGWNAADFGRGRTVSKTSSDVLRNGELDGVNLN
jgi:hypothetical protein